MDSQNNSLAPQTQEPQSPIKMTFQDYMRKVEECLMTKEGLSETEAKSWMTATWDPPLADGAKTATEELSMCYAQGLPPQTAAQVLIA